MTSLLDVLKETDLRVGFTEAFKTLASREVLTLTLTEIDPPSRIKADPPSFLQISAA